MITYLQLLKGKKKAVISAIPLTRLYSTVFSISEGRLPGGGVK